MALSCSRCGRVNRSSAAFCGGCGQPLAAASSHPAARLPADLGRALDQARLAMGRLWGQVHQEAKGWYNDLVARRPELVGEVVAAPVATTVTQTQQFYALFIPAGSQTTHLPAISFDLRPQSGTSEQAVYMIGTPSGDLYAGDRVRAWGVWDRDQGVLRAWRIEVWERGGRAASETVATGRPFPLLLIGAVLLGFLLMTCLCGILT